MAKSSQAERVRLSHLVQQMNPAGLEQFVGKLEALCPSAISEDEHDEDVAININDIGACLHVCKCMFVHVCADVAVAVCTRHDT
jgi:hypothetical protein